MCRQLSRSLVKVNVTLIFSPSQAILAAKAGATYVSPFVGRLDDNSVNGLDVIKDIHDIYQTHWVKTQILSASIRGVKAVSTSFTLKLPEFTADAVLKGAVSQSFTFGGIIGSGIFTVFGEIADPLLTFAEQPLGDIYVSGIADVVNVDIHFGVGGFFKRYCKGNW